MASRRDFLFVGIDTHKREHVAAILDCWQDLISIVTVPNEPRAFPDFLQAVQRQCPAGVSPMFGLEGTGGLGRTLAAFLVEKGYTVKEVNPVLTDRRRARDPHPDKSDPKDAIAIARVLIDEFTTLPDPRLNEHTEAVAQLVHHRERMVFTMTELKNRLHALLFQQYPRYKEMFFRPFGKTALAFWSRFPSPHHLQGFGSKRLGAFLRKHSNKTLSTERAVRILTLAERADATQPSMARDQVIQQIVAQLTLLETQIGQIEAELAELLKQNGDYLTSMVGIDVVTAGRLIAEIGDITRFHSASQLARFAGAAPQEDSSGNRRHRKHSKRGRRKLNAALFTIALTQISTNRDGTPRLTVARNYYLRKVAEGKTKKAALRCLVRRLCDVIYAMMKRREPYKPRATKDHTPAA